MSIDLEAISRLEIPLIVQIADRPMPLQEVLALQPGAIIELPKSPAEKLDVLVNNKKIGAGKALKVGENFGIQLTKVGNIQQRIKAIEAGQ